MADRILTHCVNMRAESRELIPLLWRDDDEML